MLVTDLIAVLEEMDGDAEVRFASQPSYPFEYAIREVVDVEGEDGMPIVYLAEGEQLGYLPGEAREALGW